MALVLNCWTNADSGGSTTTSLTINKPTGTTFDGGSYEKDPEAGDLLLILAGSDTNSDTLQWDGTTYFPTGFEFLYCWNNSSIQAGVVAFARVVTEGEGTSFDIPALDANEMWASCLLISGWSGSISDLVVGVRNGDGTPVPLSIPSIDTEVNNSLCIALAAFDGADSGGFTWSSPYTKQQEIYSGTGGNDASGTWATYVKATAGATGTADVTYVSTGDGMIGFQLAVAPSTNLNVSATSASRTRTTNSATVSKSRIVASATEARTRTVYNATVTTANNLDVDCTLSARTRSTYATTVDTSRLVASISAARQRTTYSTTVSITRSVAATIAARQRSTYTATVDTDREVSAASTARTRTVNSSIVNTVRGVAATSVARTRTVYNATVTTPINLDVDCTSTARTRSTYATVTSASRIVAATSAARQRSTFSASVSLDRDIAATTTARQRSILATTVSRDRDIAATVQGRARTLYNATIDTDVDLVVNCTSAARTRTVYNPVITANLEITAGTTARQRSVHNSIVNAELSFVATISSRSRTTYSTTISRDRLVDAATTSRVRTTYSAVVTADLEITTNAPLGRTRTTYDATIDFGAIYYIGATGITGAWADPFTSSSHTVAEGTDVLYVAVTWWATLSGSAANITSVTWDNAGTPQSLTELESYTDPAHSFGAVWYVVNPTPGTLELEIDFAASDSHDTYIAVACVNLFGVYTAGPFGTPVSTYGSSGVNVTSTHEANWVLGSCHDYAANSIASNDTEIVEAVNTDNSVVNVGYIGPASGAQTLDWANVGNAAYIGVEVRAKVAVDREVQATTTARERTVYSAIVDLDRDITTSLAARTRTTYNTSISTATNIFCTSKARTRSVYAAEVSLVCDLVLSCSTKARVRSIYAATVGMPLVVAAALKQRVRVVHDCIVTEAANEPDWWDFTGVDQPPADLGIVASTENFGLQIDLELLCLVVVAEETGTNAIDEGLGTLVIPGDFWLWGDGSEMLWGDGDKIAI